MGSFKLKLLTVIIAVLGELTATSILKYFFFFFFYPGLENLPF